MEHEPSLELLYRQGGEVKQILNPTPRTWGRTPAVVLINPKYPHNAGAVVRACSCYGIAQVWLTGNRVSLTPTRKFRLPREERMKGYADVQLMQNDRPLDQFATSTPVAVEVRENSESLIDFEHPPDAVYVFGPEDGSLDRGILVRCHRFVRIPTRHCINLAAAVYTVLYDRELKRLTK